MKSLYFIILPFLFFINDVFAQGVCAANIRIITPIVAKPTNAAIVSASCSTLVVKWKGNKDQAYLVTGSFNNPVSKISCDIDYNCTANIPVTPGSHVSWNVQAFSTIEGRTFYSYLLHGNQDYLVPTCNQPIVTTKESAAGITKSSDINSVITNDKMVITNEKFAMYPNPVNALLNISLVSEYKGNVKLTILDASGKAVRVITIKKEQLNYSGNLTVSSLKPGLYFLSIGLQNGQSYSGKFLKN